MLLSVCNFKKGGLVDDLLCNTKYVMFGDTFGYTFLDRLNEN